jgi:hypothetical protein
MCEEECENRRPLYIELSVKVSSCVRAEWDERTTCPVLPARTAEAMMMRCYVVSRDSDTIKLKGRV